MKSAGSAQGCNLVEVTIFDILVIVLCNKDREIGVTEKKLTIYKKNLPSILEAVTLKLVLCISNRPVAGPRFF